MFFIKGRPGREGTLVLAGWRWMSRAQRPIQLHRKFSSAVFFQSGGSVLDLHVGNHLESRSSLGCSGGRRAAEGLAFVHNESSMSAGFREPH